MLHSNKPNKESNYSSGLVLIIIGTLIFLWQLGFRLPSFLFHWYMIPIAVGIYLGAKNNFNEPYGWLIPIGIGGIFWANELFPFYNLAKFIVPIILIGIGLMRLVSRDKSRTTDRKSFGSEYIPFAETPETKSDYSTITKTESPSSSAPDAMLANDTIPAGHQPNNEKKNCKQNNTIDNDFFNAFAFMSGVKRNIVSPDFKGGDITALMGGVEINLMHADVKNSATIHLAQMMGGTSIMLPANWIVRDEITSIMGGVDDSRPPYTLNNNEPQKMITLKGFNLMGGVEIKSY